MITVTRSDLPPLKEYIGYLERIWATRWLTNDGEFVQLLQTRLEQYLGVKDLVLVANGTLALHLALKALGLKGEIITTPFTFSTTTNVILWEGLTPIFADIDPETFGIDPKAVERKVTGKTSAILATHVYGNPCAVDDLEKIAEKYHLRLVYDAAHAFGVQYKNQPVLNYGDISTLSFHATKVFNTIEGGAIVVRNKGLLERLRLLRNHGIRSEEEVVLPGTNAKMNEFQAVMGLCNLEAIDERIRSRKRLYEHYKERLNDCKNLKFQKIVASNYNYIYMPVCFEDIEQRDEIYAELIANGIRPRKYFFPLTVHFDYLKREGIDLVEKYGLKQANDIANRVLCLPLYPDLEIETVDRITTIVKRIVAR